MGGKKEFNFSEYIVDFQRRLGRDLTTEEMNKAKNIYLDLINERDEEAKKLYVNQDINIHAEENGITSSEAVTLFDNEKQLRKKFDDMESSILGNAEQLVEQHRKLQERATIEVRNTPRKKIRININYPGNVRVIASDRSGKYVDFNNKEDVGINTMRYRADVLKPLVQEEKEQSVHDDMEFE